MSWYFIVLIVVGVLFTAFLVFVIYKTLFGHLVGWEKSLLGFYQAVLYVAGFYLIKWRIRRPYKSLEERARIEKRKEFFRKLWDSIYWNRHFYYAGLAAVFALVAFISGIAWFYIPAGVCLLVALLVLPMRIYEDIMYAINPFYRRKIDNMRAEMKRKDDEWLAQEAIRKEEEQRQDEANHFHRYGALRIYKTLPFTVDGQFLSWKQLDLTEEEYKQYHQTDHMDRSKRFAIYYEPSFNAPINNYIEQHYQDICHKLGDNITFVYLPKMLDDIQSLVKYNHPDAEQFDTQPYSAEDFYNVIRENIVKIPTDNPMLLITDYHNSAGYTKEMLDETMFSCYFLDLEYLNDEQFTYCLDKNLKAFHHDHAVFYSLFKGDDDLQADYARIDAIAQEIRDRIEHLYAMGVSEYIIKQIVALPAPKLSPMLITEDYRIILTGYNNMEIEMPTLSKTLYFFYLRHPEGVMFKELRYSHRLELALIYGLVSPREDLEKMGMSIEDLVDPTKNSINEKRSRIKSAFVSKFSDEIAVNYYIVGRGAEPKTIALDRSLITDKSGILTMSNTTLREHQPRP